MELHGEKHRPKDTSERRVVEAKELFGDRQEIEISFRGETYRLRITRNDKLILTK